MLNRSTGSLLPVKMIMTTIATMTVKLSLVREFLRMSIWLRQLPVRDHSHCLLSVTQLFHCQDEGSMFMILPSNSINLISFFSFPSSFRNNRTSIPGQNPHPTPCYQMVPPHRFHGFANQSLCIHPLWRRSMPPVIFVVLVVCAVNASMLCPLGEVVLAVMTVHSSTQTPLPRVCVV